MRVPLNWSWLFTMAWRDSRRNRSRLFLFISSIILGIGALVAIQSFGENLKKEIDRQAANLVGADLVVSTGKAATPAVQAFLDSLGNRHSEERTFASMAVFPKTGGARLIQVKALSGGFPYYGTIETIPVRAATVFRKRKMALVDKTLLSEYHAKVGDPVKIGEATFTIAGAIEQAPGQNAIASTVAPIVYIPLQYLPETGLSQLGIRMEYTYYYQYDHPERVDGIADSLEQRFESERLNYKTIASEKRQTGRAFEDLTRFLSLVGFIALLLGCVGVASAIHIYVREKLPAVAVLRCMGVQAYQASLIYLIQIAAIGLIGAVAGAAAGTVIQKALPLVFKDFLPVTITSTVIWPAVFQGIFLGLLISILFALLPLSAVRRISPLNALCITFTEIRVFKDPVRLLVYGLILLFVTGFSYVQLQSVQKAVLFTLAVSIAFLLLTGAAYALIWLVRRFFPSSFNYLWRQGLSNLFRPNNQTLILVVAIGLGTGFIGTLFFIQDILVSTVALSTNGNKPNLVLFNIQSDQQKKVDQLVLHYHFPVLQDIPIVRLKIESVNGKKIGDVVEEKGPQRRANGRPGMIQPVSRRTFSDLQASYREKLLPTEKIVQGEWQGIKAKDGTISVSFEDGYAQRMGIRTGDRLVFNLGDTLLPAIVGSLRKVERGRLPSNFRVLFPVGVLEKMPQYYILVTHVSSARSSALFQQAVMKNFPTVSMIDMGLILNILDKIMDKIGFVIRFMAAFSIITGLIVLIASVLISKYQRIRESVLLRTLGATRKQILIITALEYFFLGAIASGTGILLSLSGSWALAHYSFELDFTPRILPIVLIFCSITGLTMCIGLLNSRGILNRSPLEVLVNE